METVSMARQARLAIKVTLLIVVLFFLTTSRRSRIITIAVNRSLQEKDFLQQNGFLFYKDKKFTGTAYTLYPDGDTASIKVYRKGKEHGYAMKYFSKNRLCEQRFYADGDKEGVHKGWYPDGKPRFMYSFEDGEYNGECVEWFEGGTCYRRFHYTAGYENGRQQMWWQDGSVRANYVVKNGEQFGLIGRKLCINLSHEKD
jgi:antitoxin component YwqK of YwqJK toxin-antitoxin module